MASQLSRVRWDGYGESQLLAREFTASRVTLPERRGPGRPRKEQRVAGVAPPAPVHRPSRVVREALSA